MEEKNLIRCQFSTTLNAIAEKFQYESSWYLRKDSKIYMKIQLNKNTQDNSEDGLFNSVQNLSYKALNLTMHSN